MKLAALVWAFYSVLIKKINAQQSATLAVTRKVFFYGFLFLLPVLPLVEFHSVYIYMIPVIMIVASALVLHENITQVAAIGMALILTGIALSEPEKTTGLSSDSAGNV